MLIPVILVLITACTGRGENAAHQWLDRQLASKQLIPNLPLIPEVKDTLPVAYNPELYGDPFAKTWARVGASHTSQDLLDNANARFPTEDVMSLKFLGYIRTPQGIAAMVSNNTRSESIRVGNLIGSAGWAVRVVSTSGVELGVPDGTQLVMPYQRRGLAK
jgi:Tfp pilus assembly protein PilP